MRDKQILALFDRHSEDALRMLEEDYGAYCRKIAGDILDRPEDVVLPLKCVYQKTAGEDEPWYAREVSADGALIGEIEVKLGYSNGKLVCVSGPQEGHYYDSGYGSMAGGGQ